MVVVVVVVVCPTEAELSVCFVAVSQHYWNDLRTLTITNNVCAWHFAHLILLIFCGHTIIMNKGGIFSIHAAFTLRSQNLVNIIVCLVLYSHNCAQSNLPPLLKGILQGSPRVSSLYGDLYLLGVISCNSRGNCSPRGCASSTQLGIPLPILKSSSSALVT